jgi:non-ribosomal peptide synthetase component F
VLQNLPLKPIEIGELSFTPVELRNQTAKFDLMLTFWEEGRGIRCAVEYDTDLFDSSTIARIEKHFTLTLTSVYSNVNITLSELGDLLEDHDREQLLENRRRLKAANNKLLKTIRPVPVGFGPTF